MWFSGLSSGLWRIGCATSDDGITWDPCPNNPIIDLSSQGQHADGASVIYNGSSYEMYFHGVNGNLSYTTSENGTSGWSTPVTVLTKGVPSTPYDAGYLAGPGALRAENGTTLLYYGGRSSGGVWSINLATDGEMPTPFPTPTIRPTPTPNPPRQVIVIPGATASWNADALLNCKNDGYAGDWTLNKKAQGIYQPLMDALASKQV